MSIYLLVNTNHPIIEGLLPGGSGVKESACNAGDLGLTPGLGRSPGEENGNPFQYSGWRIPWTEEPGRLESVGLQSRLRLNDFHFHFMWFMQILCIILGYNPAGAA